MTRCAFSRYEQFETSPEATEQATCSLLTSTVYVPMRSYMHRPTYITACRPSHKHASYASTHLRVGMSRHNHASMHRAYPLTQFFYCNLNRCHKRKRYGAARSCERQSNHCVSQDFAVIDILLVEAVFLSHISALLGVPFSGAAKVALSPECSIEPKDH